MSVHTLKLNDPDLVRAAGYVAGEWREVSASKATFDVTNPSTGEKIITLPDMGATEAEEAITAAHAAQKVWAARTTGDRAVILRKYYDLMVEYAGDLATILTAEMGKPWPEARGEVLYGASFIQWFLEEARRVYGDVIPQHQDDKRIIVLKQPIGVVASITPWNFPNAMIARKVAPALASGCAIVAKPAEQTPLSGIAMAVLAERAGLPAGLFSLLTAAHGAEIGKEFTTNPKVAKISFTGSTEVGRILLRQSADQVKSTSMELGGNAPFIVFDDADLDEAVAGAVICKYRNNGQTCICANRLYIQSGIYDEFVKRYVVAVKALKVGDGFGEGITTGPLIDQDAVEKVKRHIADAVAKGAEIQTGGEAHALGGQFFQPTILTGVNKEMDIAHEETFGPVAPLFKFDTVEEVIELANDTEFGLAAYFYATDFARVWKVAEALEAGIIGANTGIISTEVAPFGGMKQSGSGREGSKYGIEDYYEIKYLCVGNVK